MSNVYNIQPLKPPFHWFKREDSKFFHNQAVVFSCMPMFVSIDLHSSKPCFSVQFVDTYSIHSFPPPSRRTQQIQPFSQSGAGVSPMGKASLLCCYCLKRVRPFCRRLTVYDCHSFHSQPRQFRRATANPTIFFPFTIKTFYRSNFLSHHHLSTNFPSPHFSHPAAPALTLWGRGKGNFVSLSCTRLVAWLFHRWRFACPDFSHASPVF